MSAQTTPPRPGFVAELRDAVTVRAALLVLGVLLLQLGFIASYLGAFHDPAPRRIPVAVVAPSGAHAGAATQIVAELNQLDGRPLAARLAADEPAARRLIERRTVYGALVLGPARSDHLLVAGAAGASAAQALTAILGQVDQVRRRTLTVEDVRPAAAGDARGLSGFYLVVGWVVGGYLVAAILGIGGGARPANRHRAVLRLAVLAAYAVASGIGGALIAETLLAALSGHFLSLWALGALLVFAVGAFTMAAQVLLGTIGIGVAILLFVVLGNPSAGGAYPSVLLPPFWAAIGRWLPPGAGTDAVRNIVYFPKSSVAQPLLVLAGYAVVGLLVTVGVAGRTPAESRTGTAPAGARGG
ncbi:hypothetical protein [Micromonospora sp. NPDC049679]|uniref:hypothetical protein n=1 Tax=Micromonospora sp. NPDC049679 TaxID=3155920 RepID=UPI0033F2189A